MDLRSQLNSITCDERNVKNELAQLRQDNDNLQQRLHNLVTARQQDKQTITKLEKNLDEEKKKLKNQIDTQLANERKAKKAEEAAARAVALAAACRTECSEICKARRRDVENDLKQLQQELKLKDEQLKQSEKVFISYFCLPSNPLDKQIPFYIFLLLIRYFIKFLLSNLNFCTLLIPFQVSIFPFHARIIPWFSE